MNSAKIHNCTSNSFFKTHPKRGILGRRLATELTLTPPPMNILYPPPASCPVKVLISLPVSISQRLNVLSSPLESTYLLSGENATEIICLLCPPNVLISLPVETSQSVRVPSECPDPEMIYLPSGEKAPAVKYDERNLNVRTSSPVETSKGPECCKNSQKSTRCRQKSIFSVRGKGWRRTQPPPRNILTICPADTSQSLQSASKTYLPSGEKDT